MAKEQFAADHPQWNFGSCTAQVRTGQSLSGTALYRLLPLCWAVKHDGSCYLLVIGDNQHTVWDMLTQQVLDAEEGKYG